jgi:hypothetical protein
LPLAEWPFKPTAGISDFCCDNPDAAVVPMVVTGRETVVSWACHAGQPAVTKVQAVDDQGHARAYWRPVMP